QRGLRDVEEATPIALRADAARSHRASVEPAPPEADKTEGQNAKSPRIDESTLGLSKNNPGGVLLSHTATRAVPSAPKSLTSEFGMGSGVASSKSPPETCGFRNRRQRSGRASNPRIAFERGSADSGCFSQAESCS